MRTFVVRIYPHDGSAEALRGVVDEVASGVKTAFRTPEELLLLLARSDRPADPELRNVDD